MVTFFAPSVDQRQELLTIASGMPVLQERMVQRHPDLTVTDRCAHQQQLAASKVHLTVADILPPELDGLGIFQRSQAPATGIGRVSTGLGCPHAENDPDFLGLMVAFRTAAGNRVDFIAINDPRSPTDTPEEFLALLAATADAANGGGPLATQARLLASLARRLRLRALTIAPHVTAQTLRTVHSKTAYQQYWTGVVRARDTLGKFTFVPSSDTPPSPTAAKGPTRLSQDWRRRQTESALVFDLRWLPFLDEKETPLDDLTRGWSHEREATVGTIVFPQTDLGSDDATLIALLALEMGANPGNWLETQTGPQPALPSTRFTAARQLAYSASQEARGALPEAVYDSFFENGEVVPALATELVRRHTAKKVAGHWLPDLEDPTLA